jgi:hypothetical protein
VAPGAGAGDALIGAATVAEHAAAERIKIKVAAMVVSRPGRMVSAKSPMGTRQVNVMTVTTPTGSSGQWRRITANSGAGLFQTLAGYGGAAATSAT